MTLTVPVIETVLVVSWIRGTRDEVNCVGVVLDLIVVTSIHAPMLLTLMVCDLTKYVLCRSFTSRLKVTEDTTCTLSLQFVSFFCCVLIIFLLSFVPFHFFAEFNFAVVFIFLI